MAYQDDVATSEAARQVDHKNAANDTAHRLADQNHRARLLTASIKWGVRNGAAQAMVANGDPLPAGSFPAGVA